MDRAKLGIVTKQGEKLEHNQQLEDKYERDGFLKGREEKKKHEKAKGEFVNICFFMEIFQGYKREDKETRNSKQTRGRPSVNKKAFFFGS